MMIVLQFSAILCLIILSAFFAGTETGVYRLSRFHLRIGVEQKKPFYKMLFRTLQDGEGMILSLLLGNNLVNNLLTSLVTILLIQRMQDEQAAGFYATAILTPMLFIFGEMIPKNLFYYKADRFMPALAPLSWFCYRLFTLSGFVWLLKKASRVLSMLFGIQVDSAKAVDTSKRHQVHQIIHETQEEGLLSSVQKDMISRLIDIPNLSIADSMIPLANVEMVDVQTSRSGLLERLNSRHHTRQLVFRQTPAQVLGIIHLFGALGHQDDFTDLNEFVTALPEIDRGQSVIEAINLLRHQHKPMALITETINENKQPVGIVTMADLIEELTGELTG